LLTLDFQYITTEQRMTQKSVTFKEIAKLNV